MNATDTQPAISAEGVTKIYSRRFHDTRSLKEILTFRSPRSGAHHGPLTALRDVTFDVRPAEMVGVIGTNGAGKSTLLRLLAGITPPTAGRVHCRGRIGSLLELGAGFQDDLSGMENIFLCAAVMGIKRQAVERVLDSIIDFAELRDFIHTPVKHYSSGMYVRLGFSVAVHLHPDVMLVDEILSVGDARFQAAGFRRLLDLREQGTAAVLVSHDLHAIEALSDRLLWLERGEVRGWGPTVEVMRDYRRFLQGGIDLPERQRVCAETIHFIPEGRMGTGEMTIDAVRFLGPDGRQTQTLRPGEPMAIEFDYTAHRAIDDADVMITAEHESLKVTTISALQHGFDPTYAPGNGTVHIAFPQCHFNIGSHLVTIAIVRRSDLLHFYDHHIRLHRFSVITPAPSHFSPLLRFPVEFSLQMEGG